MEILAQSSTAFVLTHNFQGTHILGASRGRLSDSVASCLHKPSYSQFGVQLSSSDSYWLVVSCSGINHLVTTVSTNKCRSVATTLLNFLTPENPRQCKRLASIFDGAKR